jgi:hypothetical protein
MRSIKRWGTILPLAGFLAATTAPVVLPADSVNYCISKCFSTFSPSSDCPTCTGERDRCVEACGKNAYSYGAIAYGARSEAWGSSYSWETKAQAEREAMTRCSEHGNDCEVMVWFEHKCGAVATDNARNVTWGLGDGEGPARRSALDKCAQAGGVACKVKASQCSR